MPATSSEAGRVRARRLRGGALGLALLLPFAPAVSQAQTPPDAGMQVRTYTPADFARFAPSNALDMLNQAPGFSIRTDVVERGLGEATGNVLINGQRVSNKSDDILAQLRRIPAANVERIEVRDAAGLRIEPWSPSVKRTMPQTPAASVVVSLIAASPIRAASGSVPACGF